MLLGELVDPVHHVVIRNGGGEIVHGILIWTTGGVPRRRTRTGHDLARVHSVRTGADVDRMVAELADAARVAVIGGSHMGRKAAAVLAKLDKSVTLIEARDRVLARVAGEAVSRFFEGEQRAHCVDIRLESVQDANAQANTVARAIHRAAEPYDALP